MNRTPLSADHASPWLYAVTGAAIVTAAALLWLRQSNDLAATGLRIYSLEAQRQELVETRSLWLSTYSLATDPVTLERRARAMGFARPSDTVYVAMDLPRDGAPAVAAAEGNSALTLVSARPRPVAAEPGPLARLLDRERGVALASAAGASPIGGPQP